MNREVQVPMGATDILGFLLQYKGGPDVSERKSIQQYLQQVKKGYDEPVTLLCPIRGEPLSSATIKYKLPSGHFEFVKMEFSPGLCTDIIALHQNKGP
jgi:hypothetical protein